MVLFAKAIGVPCPAETLEVSISVDISRFTVPQDRAAGPGQFYRRTRREACLQAEASAIVRPQMSVPPTGKVEADNCPLAAHRRTRETRREVRSCPPARGSKDSLHNAATRQNSGWRRLLSATVVACYACSLPGCALGAALKVGTCQNGSPPVRFWPPTHCLPGGSRGFCVERR